MPLDGDKKYTALYHYPKFILKHCIPREDGQDNQLAKEIVLEIPSDVTQNPTDAEVSD